MKIMAVKDILKHAKVCQNNQLVETFDSINIDLLTMISSCQKKDGKSEIVFNFGDGIFSSYHVIDIKAEDLLTLAIDNIKSAEFM